jgi:hypothetical protein
VAVGAVGSVAEDSAAVAVAPSNAGLRLFTSTVGGNLRACATHLGYAFYPGKDMEKILYVTYDKQSFITRSGALLRSGFSVSSPRVAEDAIPLVATNEFFAVVIGNSVLRQDRIRVIQNIRKLKPNQIILYVSNIDGDEEPEADTSIEVSQDFGKLLNHLHLLEQKTQQRQAASGS